MNRNGKNIGLTLVEVLIVGVLCVLLVAFVVGYAELAREKHGNRNSCLGQLRQITLAMKAYANDDVVNQLFPMRSPRPTSSNELFEAFLVAQGYVKDAKVFRCPTDKAIKPYSSFPAADTNSYSVAHNLKDDGSTDTPILADAVPHEHSSDGKLSFTTFYSDGHGDTRPQPPLLKERLDPLYSKSIEEMTKAAHAEFVWSKRKPYAIFGGVVLTVAVIITVAIAWRRKRNKRAVQP